MSAEADAASEAEEHVDDDQEAEARIEEANASASQQEHHVANEAEHRTGSADNADCWVEEDGAERTAEQGDEVDRSELHLARDSFDLLAELPQQVHVEANVQDVGVEEPAGHDPPDFIVFPDWWAPCREVGGETAAAASVDRDGYEVHENVDRHENFGDDEVRTGKVLGVVDLLGSSGLCALWAVNADRCLMSAVDADVTVAPLAADARLAIGVAVAHLFPDGGGVLWFESAHSCTSEDNSRFIPSLWRRYVAFISTD